MHRTRTPRVITLNIPPYFNPIPPTFFSNFPEFLMKLVELVEGVSQEINQSINQSIIYKDYGVE